LEEEGKLKMVHADLSVLPNYESKSPLRSDLNYPANANLEEQGEKSKL